MKITLCSVPDGPLQYTKQSLLPRGKHWQIPIEPVGILRLITTMEKKGYGCDIYDINNLRPICKSCNCSMGSTNWDNYDFNSFI